MSPKIKKAIQYIIPPIITVGLCILLYSDVDWREILEGLHQCNYALIALFLGFNVMAMVLRGFRWRLQLRAIGTNPGIGEMSRSIFGCYAVNLVFPRLGELWRCGYIARVSSVPFSGVFGSMVADRLSDTLAVVLLALLTVLVTSSAMAEFAAQSHLGATVGHIMGSPWAIAAGVLLLIAALLVVFDKARPFEAIRRFVRQTWGGFTAVFTMRGRGRWLLLTVGIWGAYFLSMYASLLSYPPTEQLAESAGLTAVLVTFVFGSLAMAIPSNGGIGPWQVAILLSLNKIYDLPHDQALTFATLNLAFTTLLTILLGVGSFAVIAFKSRRKK